MGMRQLKHQTGTEVAPQSTARLTQQPARKPDAVAIENIFHTWHLTRLAAKDNGKNPHVGSHTTGSRRRLHVKRAVFEKGTAAPFFWGRKKAEELLCRGNDSPVFVLVIPSQGMCLGA